MSNQHVSRLIQVRLEREAAKEAIETCAKHVLSSPSLYDSDAKAFQRAADNAEKTYYFRLTAELEGMLFRHLRDYHPDFTFDPDDGAARLVNHCRHRLNPQKRDRIPNDLADDVMQAIRWRNHLVHGERSVPSNPVSFNEAFRFVHDLVLLLPPMKGSHGGR